MSQMWSVNVVLIFFLIYGGMSIFVVGLVMLVLRLRVLEARVDRVVNFLGVKGY